MDGSHHLNPETYIKQISAKSYSGSVTFRVCNSRDNVLV